MAATVDSSGYKVTVPFVIYEWQLSSLVSDQSETLTHTHTGCRPFRLDYAVVTEPTDHSVVSMQYQEANFSTTNNTVQVRLVVPPGGSLDGAKVKVWCWFLEAASGGTSPT